MFGQAVETGPACFLTSSVPRDGSTVSCRRRSLISRAIRSAACGRWRRSRGERMWKSSQRTLWRCRRVRDHRMSCGCTYHDLHTALLQTRGATPAGFNQAVYERLKPGGFYVIVDHVAAAGTGTSHAESLHRIEPAAVREEVETAGFVLDAESTVLANKDDPHSIKVFDPSIKGETDRFAYRFVRL